MTRYRVRGLGWVQTWPTLTEAYIMMVDAAIRSPSFQMAWWLNRETLVLIDTDTGEIVDWITVEDYDDGRTGTSD